MTKKWPEVKTSPAALREECDRYAMDGGSVIQPCFNPRTPWGVRRARCAVRWTSRRFNPRTPWGVRHAEWFSVLGGKLFQSTHSVGSATPWTCPPTRRRRVSIHALRGECDLRFTVTMTNSQGFNPRTPWGVRRPSGTGPLRHPRFQSTHSVGSATWFTSDFNDPVYVSIHALRGECDTPRTDPPANGSSFNPRTPWGVRLSIKPSRFHFGAVSIHALRGECDSCFSAS